MASPAGLSTEIVGARQVYDWGGCAVVASPAYSVSVMACRLASVSM